MKRSRRHFLWGLAAGGASLVAIPALQERHRSFTRRAHALGARTAITVWHDDEGEAEEALDAAFSGIDGVEEVMSLYRKSSQLSQLNREGALKDPHPDLVEVLRYAQGLSARSAGAFDVTVQPLWLARQAGNVGLGEIVLGWRQLEVSQTQIGFKESGMQATLNGIAQGFAADRVAEVLRRFGIKHALIDTGEIAACGGRQGPGGEAWRVGLQHPREEAAYLCLTGLTDRCLATSGDYEAALDDGFVEHHLIDPQTGQSPRELSSVSVAARTAMEADALSTAAFVLGLEKGMELIESTPGADAYMVRKVDGRCFASEGFPVIKV